MALNEANLEKRFNMVSPSQASIQSLSFFCLHYKSHHKKIAQIWLRCLQKAEPPHRLTLIYLANDIVQNAKRKNAPAFIDDFKNILKETVPYLRDEKIKKTVERVFSIWEDRSIFDPKFINSLKDFLNNNRTSSSTTPKIKSSSATTTATPPTTSLAASNDLLDCLKKIKSYEKYDNITKEEVDERVKLNNILDENILTQKKLLKESEDQLIAYSQQLEYIIKLRDQLRMQL